jgi:hypothetical protein
LSFLSLSTKSENILYIYVSIEQRQNGKMNDGRVVKRWEQIFPIPSSEQEEAELVFIQIETSFFSLFYPLTLFQPSEMYAKRVIDREIELGKRHTLEDCKEANIFRVISQRGRGGGEENGKIEIGREKCRERMRRKDENNLP